MSDKPMTTRYDGICARCDGAGTIPDWSAGQLPCPACKPMEQGEAVTAGAIRQSVGGEAIADVTQIRGLVRERNEIARQLAETIRIQPNDRYCPQCGTDTLRHAPDGTEYYGAHTQDTCLEIRLARAQERAERERRNKEFLTDWYSRRIHRLRRLIEEEAPSILDRACAVIANGAADVYERPECGSLANAPANPYAAVVEAALHWKAARDENAIAWTPESSQAVDEAAEALWHALADLERGEGSSDAS